MYSISYYETKKSSEIFFDAIGIVSNITLDTEFRKNTISSGRLFISIARNKTEEANAITNNLVDIIPSNTIPHHSLRFICYEDYEKSITYSVGNIPFHTVYKIKNTDLNRFLKILESGITRRMKIENFISIVYYKIRMKIKNVQGWILQLLKESK